MSSPPRYQHREPLVALRKARPVERLITDLPAGGQHATRTVIIGPDNHLYVSIGSDCDVCQEADPHRAAVWVYHLDGSQGRLYAKGLRNAVGMQVNPSEDRCRSKEAVRCKKISKHP